MKNGCIIQRFRMNVYTIGHSTRAADELSELLREHDVKLLADIRRYPGSKRYPHFASDAMARWLPEHGVAYVHMPELGGRASRCRIRATRAGATSSSARMPTTWPRTNSAMRSTS